MPGKAALIFGLLLWNAFQAQELIYSRGFPVIPKNLPLQIHNTSNGYFYVLKYNRKAHDVTLERRAKPSAVILNFTPLKLDSVNSELFNYSSLEYLLFEHKHKMYFVFKKNLNKRKSIYLKSVDSTGKASGFKEVCSLNWENTLLDFEFEWSGVYQGKLLLISTQKFFNQSTKKTAILFDVEHKQLVWSKTLPLENSLTGYSKGFCLNEKQDLFYVMVKSKILSYKRKYIKHSQIMVPEMWYDSLHLVKISLQHNQIVRIPLLQEFNALHSLNLKCDSNGVTVLAQVAGNKDSSSSTIQLFSYRCSDLFNTPGKAHFWPILPNIYNRLRYYDGTDSDLPAQKEFVFLNELSNEKYTYHLTERKEGDVYKELLLWQIQNSNGDLKNQYLIPRRMLSSETWSRYSEIGKAGTCVTVSNYHVFMAEAYSNTYTDPNKVDYYQLKKKASLGNCYLILLTPENNGTLTKLKLHHNHEFDFIPLTYTSSENRDVVFYFTNGKQEKFAIYHL